MNSLLQDLRYALRQLRKSPGFTLTAVLTLALGIGANTTILSWISGTLLNPIPGVTRTSGMFALTRGEKTEHPSPPLSYPDYADLRDGAKSVSGMTGYHDDYAIITGSAKPERIYATLASANYFDVLGLRPILGRTFLAQQNERLSAAEVVLGYELWQHRFAGDPSIVGKTIQINLHSYTIVGVAPKDFQGCKTGLRSDVWLPLGMYKQVWGWDPLDDRGKSFLNILGVLRPGADLRHAESELNLRMQRIATQYPESHQGQNQIFIDPLWRSPFGVNVYLAGTLPILLTLSALLLLLACANVANLLLVRSVARRREFAIRMAMGASRWRLVRQLMAENLMVALAGGGLALLGTVWTARSLFSVLPSGTLPLSLNVKVDSRVMLAAIFVSILTAVASGIVPALRASAVSPMTILKDEALNTSGGLHKSRLTSSLVVAQVALSLLLLTCAGLFFRSLGKARGADPGFDPSHVLLASFDLGPIGYDNPREIEFNRQLLARLRALPGVLSATTADFSPLSFSIHSDGVTPDGYLPRPHESMEVDRGIVGPEYLQTLRTPLRAGRDFTDQDNSGTQPVAIVNQAFANRYWAGQDAIGKRVQWRGGWFTVVGVAANGKYRRINDAPAPLILLPMAQTFGGDVILHIRTEGDPLAYTSAVERTVGELNPNVPLFNVTTLKVNMQMGSIFERIAVVFAGAFGLLALFLANVGIYGVVAYTTRQRTHEIGIRMALGAARADVFSQILRQGLRLTLVGLAAGIAVSLAFTRLLRGMLFGVGTADWITFATVAVILCIVALLACFIPARRAASIEPMQALRAE
ncbi:MAG: ABC transporter permease [Terracidiphilus sp.]